MQNRVRELRENQGLSQAQLAKLIDSTQTVVSRIESGKQTLTSDWMLKIALALNVHPSELIDDPAWNRVPLVNLNEPLLRIISQSVMKITRKHQQLTDEMIAAVTATLYRRYAAERMSVEKLTQQIDTATELLVQHELARHG